MNREELVVLLTELAEEDISSNSELRDHPCSVAIRAIDRAFNDIETLRSIVVTGGLSKTGSKRVQFLTGLKYNPTW